jgi:predicted DNA-binding transcriptional regulator YafY
VSRTQRLFELMQALRRRRLPVSGAELAQEIEVSLRTLYRDIASLQAMGAEIEGEAGVGYVLRPSLLLPPLMFTEEQIEALAIGAQWVARKTDEDLARAARDAIAKIAAVLPDDLRERLHDDALHVGGRPVANKGLDLTLARRAMREERKLKIAYVDPEGRRSERVIWPFVLGFMEATRLLVAWCELRTDFRTFRTDRFEDAELLPDRFPRRRRDLAKQWRGLLLSDSASPLR